MIVLLTGAGSGIGFVTAEHLARHGHVVYAGVRNEAAAEKLRALAIPAPGRIEPVALDITKAAERDAAVARVLAAEGRIDGLVNNAGMAMGGFLEDIEEDELRAVFETNVFGTWALTRAVIPAMRAQGRGRIVQVSSMAGRMAFPGLGTYAASKFALEGMSEAWRHELALHGIQVMLVEPGAYKTDIWGRNRLIGRSARRPDGPNLKYVDAMDTRFAAIVDRQARDPIEVARKIEALLLADHPRLRHPVGPDAVLRTFLVRLLPFAVVEWAVRRLFGVA